tara:strand:- start:35634 stop:36527 length:894 start_codon:yes stop_codon:yes gene_type:complete
MRVLLIGAEGQLGRSLISFKPHNIELIAKNKKELDITNKTKCCKIISEYKPDWIINSSAYTQVDEAELNIEKAFSVNSAGPNNLAKAIKKFGGNLLHFSTDFVFSGNQSKPYSPDHKTSPINVYGKTKADGEIAILESLSETSQASIIRTSWLLGSVGRNFALTMLKLHKNKEYISVVNDQIGSPTTTSSLANASWKLVRLKSSKSKEKIIFPSICHYSDAGIASWYDLAVAIGEISEEIGLIEKAAKVIPIPSSSYPTKALRPDFSVLDCSRTYKLLDIEPTHWRASLYKLLKELI